MLIIFISLFIFILASVVHILIFRLIKKFTIWSFLVYLLGFLINLYTSFTLRLPVNLPYSTNLFYLLLCGVYFIFLTAIVLEDQEGPATKIFRDIRKHGQLTDEELIRGFSDEKLIVKRLKEMGQNNWIKEDSGYYSLAPRGLWIMRVIRFYRGMLSWERSG